MKLPKIVELVLCFLVVIIAVLLYKSTANFPATSQNTTAVYVKFLSICFGILGAIQIVMSFFSNAESEGFIAEPKKFILLIISLVSYVFLLDKIGFIFSTMIFLPVTMFFMGYEKKGKSILISICIVIFVYVLFVKIFEIQLPEASLWA
jgi:putative tricarboxylic transport membrane protein